METLGKSGFGSFDIPDNIKRALTYVYNLLVGKINEIIENPQLDTNELAAMTNANSPSSSNPLATMEDAGYTSKWKTYRALITQTGTAAPVARVLNQDEPDYLGDAVWTRSSEGNYVGTFTGTFSAGRAFLLPCDYYDGGSLTITRVSMYYEANNAVRIVTLIDGAEVDEILSATPIEIKIRQQGAAPTPPTAETNLAGDVITLTFLEDMNDYIFGTVEGAFTPSLGKAVSSIARGTDHKTIELTLDAAYSFGDVITLTYDASVPIETFLYGPVAAFTNLAVTNNVPEP